MNRLASATSPYLLQHADNPVDWWPWSDDAFAEARRRDVPVLISVGYSSCHWCHVMAHESFEDEGVADIVNAGFVAIKVDREERPDVDAVYMTATQAMSGQGGWPMTVFATPSGEPFFAGTYFPRPNFLQLLDAVSAAWRDQREAVLKQSTSVVESISRSQRLAAGPGSVTPEQLATALDQAAAKLGRDFDERYGGFGGAPKFPPHLAMLFLARYHGRTGDERALEMARATAEQMARGGIYDQLAGGFARYAVDGTWTVPHFEKMLYDNALLLRVYTELWRETGDPMCGRVARETAAFLVAGLGTPEGGFASALDADTAGVEGLTYVWTPEQLSDALGADDGGWAADLFGVTAAGTFEHGTSVLRLARDIDGLIDADAEGQGTGNTVRRWDSVRERLMAVRAERPQPARDDKVVAEWNGLAITGLTRFAAVARAVASTVSGALVASGPTTGVAALGAEADAALAAAVAAGEVLVRVHIVDGRLRRVSRDGAVGAPAGVLADYGAVAHAFCALYQATTDPRWLTSAGSLLDHALARFPDGTGGFFDTADDAEALVTRPADPTDNATPSGTSSMIEALITYTALTGETRYREAADAALAAMIPVITEHPRFAGMAAADAEQALSGPLEIAITGPDETGRSALVTAAVMRAAGGTVIVSGAPDEPGHPLLTSRPAIGGAPAAYICRGFVCERPVTTVAELTAQLARR